MTADVRQIPQWYVLFAVMVSLIAWQGFPSAWAQSHVRDATSVEVVSVGGTFPFPLYQQWIEENGRSHPGIQFHNVPARSAEGMPRASNGISDFGGCDVSLKDVELAKALDQSAALAFVVRRVAPIHNLPGSTQELRFRPEVLACIYLGTIHNWNDPVTANRSRKFAAQQTIEVIYQGEPAKKMNMEGTVKVEATILPMEPVKSVTTLGGNPVLSQAVADAVKQWKYVSGPAETKKALQFRF